MDIKEEVAKIIKENLGVTEYNGDSSFVDDLGADSLDQVEFVMAAEEVFEIEITDEEAEKIMTVDDAIKLIETKVSSK